MKAKILYSLLLFVATCFMQACSPDNETEDIRPVSKVQETLVAPPVNIKYGECKDCSRELDLIQRVDNQGNNVVLGQVQVCIENDKLCFDFSALGGTIGSVKIGIFESFEDVYNQNNNPAPKNFTRTVHLNPRAAEHKECLSFQAIADALDISVYELKGKTLYITALAQISGGGGTTGGQGWAGALTGNAQYPFDRYFTFKICKKKDDKDKGCTYTQGYWKTHGPGNCAKGNNTNEWPVTSLRLGGHTYYAEELCAILNSPVRGTNLGLTHQLIAALLNHANGAYVPSSVRTCIYQAQVWLKNNGGIRGTTTNNDLTKCLADYNEGKTGPGSCKD